MPQANPQAAKPAKLQVNLAGAWKDVARFDAGDKQACTAIMDGARDIGHFATGAVSFRICKDDALNEVLMRWTRSEGWKEQRHAAH